jgi:hypothetical protein
MNNIRAGHQLEQLVSYVSRGPVASRCHVDLGRIGLGVGDKLRNRLGWDRWILHYDKGLIQQISLPSKKNMVCSSFVHRRASGLCDLDHLLALRSEA